MAFGGSVNDFMEVWKQNGQDQGYPYISNYKSNLEYGNQNLDITVNSQNLIFLANRRGVQIFDGINWQRVILPFLVYNVESNDDKVFIGGDNNLGYIARNDSGRYFFKSLKMEHSDVGIVDRVSVTERYVFFGGYKSVFRYNKASGEVSSYVDTDPVFNGMMAYGENVYVNVRDEGLWEFPVQLFNAENDTTKRNVVEKLPFKQSVNYKDDSLNFSREEVLFAIELSSNKVLLGTSASALYTFNGKEIKLQEYEDALFLRESIITDGTRLNARTFAVSTRTGGSVVIDIQDGESLHTINYQTGLSDDEVHAVASDINGGLWMVHPFGISRVDFRLPVRAFSQIPGLEGINTTIFRFQGALYVGTSEGLYYKKQVKNYKEIKEVIRVKQQQNKQEEEEQESLWNRIFNSREKEKKKEKKEEVRNAGKEKEAGVIRRFFNKLTGKDKTGKEEEPSASENKLQAGKKDAPKNGKKANNDGNKAAYEYKIKKSYALQSVKYVFKKVSNLQAKVVDTKIVDKQLLIGTNKGLYYMDENRAVPVIENIYVYQLSPARMSKAVWVASRKGFYLVQFHNGKWHVRLSQDINKPVYSIVEPQKGRCWLGIDDMAIQAIITEDMRVKELREYPIHAPFSERVRVMSPRYGELLVAADKLLKYDNSADSLRNAQMGGGTHFSGRLLNTQDSLVWQQSGEGWQLLHNNKHVNSSQIRYLEIFADIRHIHTDNDSNLWLVNGSNDLYKIAHAQAFNPAERVFRIHISDIENKAGYNTPLDDFKMAYNQNALRLKLGAPYYLSSDKVQFQYKLEGLSEEWSDWRSNPVIEFPFIPYGNYDLKIRGKNLFGQLSDIRKVAFTVKAPFWLQWWFVLLLAIAIIAVTGFIVHLRLRALRRENRILEEKVQERTREIQEKQKEITKSIEYGRRIQRAMLPPEDTIKQKELEHFTFYKPRDIVSGDFYWYSQRGNKTYYAAVDCTGHGVPGAFLSMLGMAFLNEIVNERRITRTSAVLNELRKYMIRSLRQEGAGNKQQDGMDMALVMIDHEQMQAEFAGAYNPLYVVRGGEISRIKPNRMPIGIYHGKIQEFSHYQFELKQGDQLYIFSDGFADQIGGPKGRKYMSGHLKRFLLQISGESMKSQHQYLEEEFLRWKGEHQQIDDVLIMGIRML